MHLFKLLNRQKLLDEEPSCWRSYPEFLGRVLLALLACMLALALLFGLALGAIMSANIMTDPVVLSDHPDCGLWLRDESIKNPSPTGFDYLQEVEAGQYSKKCYHSRSRVDGCNTFMTQSISYDKFHHQQCPFEDNFCSEGKKSAYRLETKYVSSKSLGINVDIGYTFKRSSTCSPVRRRVTLSPDGKEYEYDYGNSTDFGALSWRSPANKAWDFAGYNVVTLYYKANSSISNWSPSSEFAPWDHKAITLLLIDSQKNFHTAPSHDPIFPAEHSLAPYPERSPLYFNDDPRATALACVDTTEICDANGQICYDNIYRPYPELQSHEEMIGYYMLLISLTESTTFDAIQLVGGRALDAEAKLERQISLPLAEEQWKVEVENLFETTLVRPQITLRDYIRGRAAKDPEYADRTSAGMHNMCQAYKFRGRGWKNISVWGIVIIVAIVVIVYILSIRVKGSQVGLKTGEEEFIGCPEGEDIEGGDPSSAKGGEKVLLAEWIFDYLFKTSTERARVNDAESRCETPRNSTEGGRASPRIRISGPGQPESHSPDIPGSDSGQNPSPATTSAGEERNTSAAQDSRT